MAGPLLTKRMRVSAKDCISRRRRVGSNYYNLGTWKGQNNVTQSGQSHPTQNDPDTSTFIPLGNGHTGDLNSEHTECIPSISAFIIQHSAFSNNEEISFLPTILPLTRKEGLRELPPFEYSRNSSRSVAQHQTQPGSEKPRHHRYLVSSVSDRHGRRSPTPTTTCALGLIGL